MQNLKHIIVYMQIVNVFLLVLHVLCVSNTIEAKNGTLCVNFFGTGGFGNRVIGLAAMAAIANAAGRPFAFTKTNIMWHDAWYSEYDNNTCHHETVHTCTITSSIPSEHCEKLIFDMIEQNVLIKFTGHQGTLYNIVKNWPRFQKSYQNALYRMGSPPCTYPSYAVVLAYELPKILYKPKPLLKQAIQHFETKNNISVNKPGAFDLAIHVRFCVDCPVKNKNADILRSLQCARNKLNLTRDTLISTQNKKIFLTSDKLEAVHFVKHILHDPWKIYHNIPAKMIHTASSKTNTPSYILPYLDNFLLGMSNSIISCWTTFAQIGFLRTGGIERLNNITQTKHLNGIESLNTVVPSNEIKNPIHEPCAVHSEKIHCQKNEEKKININVEPNKPQQIVSARQSNYSLLTILIDNYGSCPESCTFIHNLLPVWVRYHYSEIGNNVNLLFEKQIDTHVLFIARKHLYELGHWAINHRKRTGYSVGILHMADELNMGSTYSGFDYVLRHYYFKELRGPAAGLYIRALGNLSCGQGPTWPEHHQLVHGPPLGVHWMFLPMFKIKDLFGSRLANSVWPATMRPINCVFSGRETQKRIEMYNAFKNYGQDLNCSISLTNGFGKGAGPWGYATEILETAKFGLNPSGNNVECLRLPELLGMGTIPAMLDAPFLHATFQQVPVISGRNWGEVIMKIKEILQYPNKVDHLQMKNAYFYQELQRCMASDLEKIFYKAMNLS